MEAYPGTPPSLVEDEIPPVYRGHYRSRGIYRDRGFERGRGNPAPMSRSDIRIVITDLKMPGCMDGLMLAHAVRDRWLAGRNHRHIPKEDRTVDEGRLTETLRNFRNRHCGARLDPREPTMERRAGYLQVGSCHLEPALSLHVSIVKDVESSSKAAKTFQRMTDMGFFSKEIKTMDDLFVHTLRDIYYAERQIGGAA